jgi:hypothetical protein
MAVDPSTPRSRRAILAAAAGAAAATVVGAVAKPSQVRAAGDDGSIVHIGDFYADAQSQTTWSNQTNDNIVLWVASNPDSGGGGGQAIVGYSDHGTGVTGQSNGSGTGVYGTSSSSFGVNGASSSGIGVNGASTSNYGVRGSSTSNYGVRGTSGSNVGVLGDSSSGPGVRGNSTGSVGVYGESGSTSGVSGQNSSSTEPAVSGWALGNAAGVFGLSGNLAHAAKAKTGVYGYAAQDNFSRGVIGESPAGIGLYGISSTGYGVYAAGKVYTTKWYELTEISAPAAPGANRARLFARVNGLGKTQLCVRFQSGAVQVIKTEP